jgi:PAS domain S-box-containing protein
MVSRNHFADPAARFVTDFTRLIRDVDRLMVDLRSATVMDLPGKTNGDARKPTLNATISTLREHARSFVKSFRHIRNDLDRVPVPCLELDRNARILETNREAAEMLNRPTTLRGRSLFTFVAGSDVKRLREHLANVRQTNKPGTISLTFVQKGKQSHVELRIRPHSNGSKTAYVVMVESANQLRDFHSISSRTSANGQPTQHELVVNLNRAQTLKSVADTVVSHCGKAFGSLAAMIFLERSGNLQLISEWRPKQISKTHPVQEMISNGPVARAFREGKPVVWSPERKPHSSVYQHLRRLVPRSQCRHVHFLPISAPEQRPIGVLAIVLPDVEAGVHALNDLQQLGEIVSGSILRARAYDEALAACVRAENTIRRKDEFLSVLSHELKNPMMPILGWAVALSSGALPADKQNSALDGIVRNVRTLNYLIEDLFDVARIASGKLRLQPEEIRIQEVAREALSAIQHNAEARKLRISTDISEAIPPIYADPRRLRQVLMNLLNNAVKFTPGGGSIALKIFRRGDSVECSVSDTGKGIEPKFLPLVFERFSQEERPLRFGTGGLGLGLAIVREIVELHGGTIVASSDGIDKGATFTLRLPMRKRHARAA